jgi:hypothetical protein
MKLTRTVFMCWAATLLLGAASAFGATLLDQPKVGGAEWTVMLDLNFETASDANDIFLADDFVVPAGRVWQIESITIHGAGWNGFTSLTTASDLQCFIFPDDGGLPSGVPLYDDASSLWSEVWAPSDANITINEDVGNWIVDFTAEPIVELEVSEGTYWLSCFASRAAAAFGYWGIYDSTDNAASHAGGVNPGGGLSLPTTWTDISTIWSLSFYGLAFNLEGADMPADDDDDDDTTDDDTTDDDATDDDATDDDATDDDAADDDDDDDNDDAADDDSGDDDDDDSSGCGC